MSYDEEKNQISPGEVISGGDTKQLPTEDPHSYKKNVGETINEKINKKIGRKNSAESNFSNKTKKQSNETFDEKEKFFASGAILDKEGITNLGDKIAKIERETTDSLLDAFASVVGFSGGLERFLGTLEYQLNISGVELERGPIEQNINQFMMCRAYGIFLRSFLPADQTSLITDSENRFQMKQK